MMKVRYTAKIEIAEDIPDEFAPEEYFVLRSAIQPIFPDALKTLIKEHLVAEGFATVTVETIASSVRRENENGA